MINRPAVKVGIGEREHERELRAAGAENCYLGTAFESAYKMMPGPIRDGDTVIMVTPRFITEFQMQEFARYNIMCQVIGHKPMLLDNPEKRLEFKRQKQIAKVPKPETRRGRPRVYPKPTSEQIAAIVALWHSSLKLAAVIDEARKAMGTEVPDWWVRDLVQKSTGSAARDANHPNKKEG